MRSLTERYEAHVAAALAGTCAHRAWHIAAARGLYRLLGDQELAGGPPAPMGMPHVLTITDDECRALARRRVQP
jgi:hypothetical protein